MKTTQDVLHAVGHQQTERLLACKVAYIALHHVFFILRVPISVVKCNQVHLVKYCAQVQRGTDTSLEFFFLCYFILYARLNLSDNFSSLRYFYLVKHFMIPASQDLLLFPLIMLIIVMY